MSENNKFLGQGGIGYLWSKIKANFLGKDEAYSKEEVDTKFDELKEVATSGSYNDLTDKPTIPTKTSQLTNDSGFKTTDNNTTYTLSKSGSTIVLTGSDGQTSSVSDDNTTYNLSSFGVNATATELNYTDGVTSNIQTQLDGKVSKSGDTMSGRLTLNVSDNGVTPAKQSLVINGIETTDVALCPGISMHIPNKAYASLKYIHDGSWRFYNSSCTGYVPVIASTFHGNLNGNATSATKATQDGNGNIITSTYAPIGLVDRVTTLENWKATFGGLTFKKESNGSVTISVV